MATVQITPVTHPFFNALPAERRVRLPAIIGRAAAPGDLLDVDLTHPGYRPLRAGERRFTAGADGRCWAVEVRHGSA